MYCTITFSILLILYPYLFGYYPIHCDGPEALQPVNKEYAFELYNICSSIINYELFYIVISGLLTIAILLGIVYLASTQNSGYNQDNGQGQKQKDDDDKGCKGCRKCCKHPPIDRFQVYTFMNRTVAQQSISDFLKCSQGNYVYPSNLPNG
jgi:hypothetical protein